MNIQEETEYLDKFCAAEEKIKKELQELGEKWSDGTGTVVMNTQRNKQTEKLLADLNDIQKKKQQIGERLGKLWEGDKKYNIEGTFVGKDNITKASKDALQFVIDEDGMKNKACNKSVYYAFEKLTGNQSLKGKLANQMFEHISKSVEWKEISGPAGIQSITNSGKIIIAIRPDKPSGHVVLIVPGVEKMSDSKHWNCIVPMTMDTGDGHRWCNGYYLSDSFGKDKKKDVKYFIYIGQAKK